MASMAVNFHEVHESSSASHVSYWFSCVSKPRFECCNRRRDLPVNKGLNVVHESQNKSMVSFVLMKSERQGHRVKYEVVWKMILNNNIIKAIKIHIRYNLRASKQYNILG